VDGARIEAGEDGARRGRHHRYFMILPGEGADGIERGKIHQRDELDLVAGRAPKQLDFLEARDIARQDARKNLLLQEVFVGVGILRRGPAVPKAGDHR
jgi:hypothetical protein